MSAMMPDLDQQNQFYLFFCAVLSRKLSNLIRYRYKYILCQIITLYYITKLVCTKTVLIKGRYKYALYSQ